MRILTITPSLSIGGTERGAQNYTIGYKKQGHEVVVLNHGRDGIRRQYIEAAGCQVHTVSHVDRQSLDGLNLGIFDVVHIHREGRKNERENEILAWVRGATKIIAETNVFFAIDYGKRNSLIDVHFQLAEINRQHWLRRGGDSLTAVIPYPVDVRDFPLCNFEDVKQFRTRHKIPANAFVFGRIGQPIPGKWDPMVVREFAKLAADNSNVYLLLVGPSKDVLGEVLALAKDVGQRVLMLDTLDDPRQLGICYSSMDCFLHAARQGESFGFVLTEALLYGVPVITLSRPHRDNAQTEVIRHNLDGLVVRSRAGILPAMKQIMIDRTLREKVRLFGRNGVVERFGMDAVCSNALAIFDRLIDSQPTVNCFSGPVGKIDYEVEGIGRSARFELVLAHFYDYPWVNYCRENLLTMRRKVRRYWT
jgi:glycosyltransferase involved in cell wall biosynthesis